MWILIPVLVVVAWIVVLEVRFHRRVSQLQKRIESQHPDV